MMCGGGINMNEMEETGVWEVVEEVQVVCGWWKIEVGMVEVVECSSSWSQHTINFVNMSELCLAEVGHVLHCHAFLSLMPCLALPSLMPSLIPCLALPSLMPYLALPSPALLYSLSCPVSSRLLYSVSPCHLFLLSCHSLYDIAFCSLPCPLALQYAILPCLFSNLDFPHLA